MSGPFTPSVLDLLARAIAGRRISVHATAGSELHAYCNRHTIFLPEGISTDPIEARNAVLAQSLLLSSESLDAGLLRSLIGRPAAARRYAWLEILRAIEDRRDQLPPTFLRHPSLVGRARLTFTATESLALALKNETSVGEIPDFIGPVRPLAVLRAALAQEGVAALMCTPASVSAAAELTTR